MTLSTAFPFRQLLSATAGALALIATHGAAFAQAGADTITLNTNPPQVKSGVLITGVTGGRVMVREGAGEIGYDLSQIAAVVKAAPPEFAAALQNIEAGRHEAAIPQIKAITDKFRGLPTPWARDATAMLGNLYIGAGKLVEAEVAIKEFKTAYAGGDSVAANVAEARLAAARKQYERARSIAAPLVADALQKKNVTRNESQIFGQAFYVLGQCAEAENKLPEAMEHYCRTVAIFYQEPSIVADAQKRIDDLRKKGVTTP